MAPQAAIGCEEGEVEINISGNSVSSSILDMSTVHTDAAPDSAYINIEKVKLTSLDLVGPDYLNPNSNLFIKIDTQGYESQVLQGATELLPQAVGIQLELSSVELYHGQILCDAMISKLAKLGFTLWNIEPVFTDPNTGRLLQFDATFFRTA